MQQISKQQKEYLLAKNMLKLVNGRYPELHVTSRQKKKKKYYVPDYIITKLNKIK